MKRSLIFPSAFCLLFAFSALSGQSTSAYQYLPAWLYPSGILHNLSPTYLWSFRLDSNGLWHPSPQYQASPYYFPGSIPAPLVDQRTWMGLYNEMHNSTSDSLLIPSARIINERDSIARLSYEVPIAAMHLDFHRVMPGSVDSGYLYFDSLLMSHLPMPDTLWLDRSNGLYRYHPDPDSLARLAMGSYELFAGSLTKAVHYTEDTSYSLTFGFPRSLMLSNQTDSMTYMEMDFANGQGFRQIQFDQPETVSYTDPAIGDANHKILRLRLHYGSRLVETRMPLVVVTGVRLADSTFLASSLNFDCALRDVGYDPTEALLSIRYGNPQKELRKPVLLIEGFETALRPYGDITYNALSSGKIYNANGDRILEHMERFRDAMDTLEWLGYDLIYIDFKNGREWIQSNALTAVKVIQWINRELQLRQSDEKLVVIGASMGGLIARYALTRMEKEGCCHNTKTYITYDSPHNGAHIPLGLQATVRHLHDQLGWADNLFGVSMVRPPWSQVLLSPAAQQMLIDHLHPGAAAIRDHFMQELDSLGHPAECRRVALINGSENGLSNQISDGGKAFFQCEQAYPLPKYHLVGSPLQPIANVIGIRKPFDLLTLNSFAESRSDGVVFQHNDISESANRAAIILALHGVSVVSQFAGLGLMAFPPNIPFAVALIHSVQALTNIVLPALHNANDPDVLYNGISAPILIDPTNNLSESPGGRSNTAKVVADNFFGLATLITPEHSFVPSISALDLDTNDLYLNVEMNMTLFSRKMMPFDNYWAPGREEQPSPNLAHVEINADNLNWLVGHVHHPYTLINAQTGSPLDSLDTSYNFGRPQSAEQPPFARFLYDLDVVSGGELSINRSGPVGFVGASFQNTSEGRFICKTAQNCTSPEVRIFSGGLFRLGDPLNDHAADMHFRSGSVLELHAGSELIVHDQSRFILEEGAELRIYPGAVIRLDGPDAELLIQGKIRLGPDASFAPLGTGRIVFDQHMGWPLDPSAHWSVDSTSRMAFLGAQRIEFRSGFSCPPLDSLILDGVEVALAGGMRLEVYQSHLLALGAGFNSMDSSFLHEGLHLMGQPVHMANCSFRNGVLGLSNNCTPGNGHFNILSCRFTQNGTGMRVRDASRLMIRNCVAENNQVAYLIEDLQGVATLRGGSASNNQQYGLKVNGQQSAVLRVIDADLMYNHTAVEATGVNLRARCSDFSHSSWGISASGHNRVLLNDQAGNRFVNNFVSVGLTDCSALRMENGHNSFDRSTWYVQGSLHPLNAQIHLDLSANAMPGVNTGNAVLLPVSLHWDAQGTPVSLPLVNWSPGFTSALGCISGPQLGPAGNEELRALFLDHSVPRTISTTHYTQLPLHWALADAAYQVSSQDSVFNDTLAIRRFDEVLSSLSAPFTDAEIGLIELALEAMGRALNNAYDQGLIQRNAALVGQSEEPLLALVSAQIQAMIQYFPEGSEAYLQNEFLLAQTYRMAEHFDYAGDILSDMVDENGSSSYRSDHWQCICLAESDLMQELIDPQTFQLRLQTCHNTFATASKRNTSILAFTEIKGDGSSNAKAPMVYPNPVRSVLFIEWQRTSFNWTIMDMSGRALLQGSFSERAQQRRIDCSSLPNAAYLIKFESADRKFSLPLSIVH